VEVGSPNPVNIELYKGGERVSGEINQPNNGSHTLFIPKHAVNGKDYRLRISDAKNTERWFILKISSGPKIPLLLKYFPVWLWWCAGSVLSKGGGGVEIRAVRCYPG